MIETCWFYQCPNLECNCVGITNNVVMEHRYPDGVVKCPKCGQQMERVREALPGEYDPQGQEELARQATPLKFTLASSWETECRLYAAMYGSVCPHYSNSPSGNTENPTEADPARSAIENRDLLTEADVAHTLGAPVSVVRHLVKKGKLRSIKLGKRKQVFTRELIEEFIQREAGFSSANSKSHQLAGSSSHSRSISLEESRSLLKELRKSSPEPDEECRSVATKTRR
jgi:excisionase family DNA binding protein